MLDLSYLISVSGDTDGALISGQKKYYPLLMRSAVGSCIFALLNQRYMKLPIAQVRIARPTDKFEQLVRFYHHGLDFPIIGSFKEHAGYNGVMLGIPDAHIHLEFTEHVSGSACPAPTKDNLLVLYYDGTEARDTYVARLTGMGYLIVEPENPYWLTNGITIEDPDGWRVVLFDKPSFLSTAS